jgi:uncharacterized protein
VRLACRPLTDSDRDVLVAFLEEGMPADAYLLDAYDEGGAIGFFGAWEATGLAGVAYVKRSAICAAARTPASVALQLAATLSARGTWSAIVGPEEPCGAIAHALRTSVPFRVDRVQAFMAIDRGQPAGPGGTGLRRATKADLAELVPLIASYRVEDGLSPPDEDHSAWIRAHTAERIGAGHLYVLAEGDRIVFTAAFNFAGRRGAGIGGVYTVPERRGRGIASRATADLARIALAEGPAVTLHVDRRNASAIRAYEKAGFTNRGEFRLTFR